MKNVTDNLVINNDDLNIKSMKELKNPVSYGKDISADFKVQSPGTLYMKITNMKSSLTLLVTTLNLIC